MKNTIQNIQDRSGAAAGRPARGGGFTLIELLIAVGALALIAVAVAAIFEATGRTVRAGRQVSAFSAYANLIQTRMRDDIAAMSRDGFLVIRNEYADVNGDGVVDPTIPPNSVNPDAVPQWDADQRPRLRRTDELMFFAKGEFTSIREMLDPSFAARADAARIYYGHGRKSIAPPGGYSQTDPYYNPSVDDQNDDADSRLGYYNSGAPAPNPNRFASDWVLLRHVTLLRPPQTGGQYVPNPRPYGMAPGRLVDNDIQIGMQPAASNIFRSLSFRFPVGATPCFRDGFDAGYLHPAFSSGLVDIATTDLSEVRAIVLTADRYPNNINNSFFDPAANNAADGSNAGVDGLFRRAGSPGDAQMLDRMQSWMSDALPTWSNPPAAQSANSARIRFETAPPNFVGVVSDTALTQEERAGRRADQIMLSASNFLPRCTEFIVEWSFGDVYPSDPADPAYVAARAGETVWFGMQRTASGKRLADFYLAPYFPYDQPRSIPFTLVNGNSAGWAVNEQLIHGWGFNIAQQTGNPGEALTSYFGYVDPQFNPDLTNNGRLDDPGDSRVTTLPCPWPKLIRVTLSLADPNDPSTEQTFQFVFDVPARPQ